MESFYTEIKTKTLQNIEKMRLEKKNIYDNRVKELTESMNILKKEILEDLEHKIEEASNNGYNYKVIYAYSKDEKMNGTFYKNFLLRGPNLNKGYGKGLDYFNNHGLTAILDDIKNEISPFKLSIKYNKNTNMNTVAVHW
jgi:hypothetical protein